ncbi:MAG TPA: lysophospholipid acyltransferase family protein [Chthoniobacterales bacterium]
MTPFWKRVRHRAEWLFVRIGAALIPLFPRGLIEGIGSTTGLLASFIDREGRQVALSNLEFALGPALTHAARKRIVRESYRHFGRAMTDLFWSPHLTAENFSELVEFAGIERWNSELEDGKPLIFGCHHYSNFEWMGVTVGLSGRESVIMAQEFKNPLLDSTFIALRQHGGHRVVAREGALLHLYRALRRGKRVAIFADLTVSAKIPSVVIDCFGMKRCVSFAPAWLHQRTGAPIINAHTEPLPDGRYRVVFHPPLGLRAGATAREIAQACWDQFEPVVRQNPAPWMWMYKHWRYRPEAVEPGAYPFYANVSPHFEKRLKESEATVPQY